MGRRRGKVTGGERARAGGDGGGAWRDRRRLQLCAALAMAEREREDDGPNEEWGWEMSRDWSVTDIPDTRLRMCGASVRGGA